MFSVWNRGFICLKQAFCSAVRYFIAINLILLRFCGKIILLSGFFPIGCESFTKGDEANAWTTGKGK